MYSKEKLMSDFKIFADAVNARFMDISTKGDLFKTNVSKEKLWQVYQDAYEPQYNPIFRERRVHDCQTCYSFIKRLGGVVAVVDNKLETIWDLDGLPEPYNTVAEHMHALVSQENISSPFLTDEALAGKEFNIEASQAGDIRWDHFYADIDASYVTSTVSSERGAIETTVSVFKRALEEFSEPTLETVIDLCDNIYRGEEFQPTVVKFLEAKRAYELSNKSLFIWTDYKKYPSKIRNTAIGTLIIDIQTGVDLEEAVSKYEKVVAPTNYKRTTAVVTEGMKNQAKVRIDELGLRPSLPRRHAQLDDISVNDVLFATGDAQTSMLDPIDHLLDATVQKSTEAPTNCQEVSIDEFLSTVLPNSKKVEALVENKHLSNLVSLVAPIDPTAPNMLKWDNNFSWSYAGEVTDAMKERVKAAGGSVTGVLRFSLQWNEQGMDAHNDLDAHCKTPNTLIYYSRKSDYGTGGVLDIDITRPGGETAVENITWPTVEDMRNGTYEFRVNNYNGTNRGGFRAQIEFNGEIFEYNHVKPVSQGSTITVATVTLANGKFTINHSISSTSTSKTEWDVSTKQYQEVSTIMLSPNFWNGQSIGNKHFFFMLKDCKNPDNVRGFYNEFLREELRADRKVFEILSSAMKCAPCKDQLSGLGFSSTVPNNLFVKVDNRPYKIKF